jgi:tRNA pseudouridine55 synthase
VTDGLVLLDKPADCTSADVVRRIKRALPRGVKVGHLGTLDPFATGLLPLCVGEATKIAQFLNAADKAYAGVIQCGAATDTGDCTGTVTRTAPVPPFTDADLRRVEQALLGEQLQVPPMYSAIKQGGVPLYRLAREGR